MRIAVGVRKTCGEAQRHTVRVSTSVARKRKWGSYEAYTHWRQVEEEAPDYWERYAAIIMQWEQVCSLLQEYAGEIVANVDFGDGVAT